MKHLAEKAVLISLNVGKWTNRKLDKEVTDKVNADYGASSDASKTTKSLVNSTEYDAVCKVNNEAHTFYYEHTLPWTKGWRILPVQLFIEVKQTLENFGYQFQHNTSLFLDNWDDIVVRSKSRLNGMFKESDYPDKHQLRQKFHYGIDFQPLPDDNDYRRTLLDQGLDELEAIHVARLNSKYECVIKELWERMSTCVGNIVERLGDKDNIFRDSLFENIKSLVALLPSLNLGNDPDIEAMRAEIDRRLTTYDPEELRKDENLRKQAHDEAADLLEKMKGYCIK